MATRRFLLLLLLFLLTAGVAAAAASFRGCLEDYEKGGAPGVYTSRRCRGWTDPYSVRYPHEPVLVRASPGCHPAVLQGRRDHMEDRVLCALHLDVPFQGLEGVDKLNTSLVAVFDGHGGEEASSMLSRLILEYFKLHIHFLTDPKHPLSFKTQSGRMISWNDHSDLISNKSLQLEIMKESLLRAIRDIDNDLTKEAYTHGLTAGSTASVVLMLNGQIFVANVGDSKSFLCSKDFYGTENGEGGRIQPSYDGVPFLYSKDLTVDHHPDREDEKARIEAAGGHVVEYYGIPRVMGGLAMSRAIGDLQYKRYGVIPVPEVTDWQALSENDSYLVVASDGIFERMSTNDVCKLLHDVPMGVDDSSLSKFIVDAAYKGGSTDNLSAIVIPLAKTQEKCKQGLCSSLKQEAPKSETCLEL